MIFDDNEISGSGADCPLAQGLARNKTLKVLGLENCSLDVSAIGRLLDVIVAPRSAVQTISLGNVALPSWTPPATHLVAPPKSICLCLGDSDVEAIRSLVALIKSNPAFLTAVHFGFPFVYRSVPDDVNVALVESLRCNDKLESFSFDNRCSENFVLALARALAIT